MDLVALGVGLAIFATIALINAPRAAIWFDEAFSAYLVQFNFIDIALFTGNDVHPPLYYWLLKIWTFFFGTTELALRSLSIALAAATIAVAFFMARKLFGRRVAWVSLLFLILSPMLIRYSDEARMYTLSALIVLSATYVLLKAEELKRRRLWVGYGVLVSLGMWTHYFTALAWLAHWMWRGLMVWRKGDGWKKFRAKFFTEDWIVAYAVAIGLYLAWLPFMLYQLGVVQFGGFWIGPVGVDTPANYFTNYFMYLEHSQVTGWAALVLLAVVATVVALLPRVRRGLSAAQRKGFALIASLAWVPPGLLFLASLPPLRSSFVERYLVPSLVALSIFLAIVLVVGTRRWKPWLRAVPVLAIVGMMIFGITNVYYYGNFNKNSNTHILTREVVEAINAVAEPGVPIVASSPWVFYEAIPYATADHPVYFIDAATDYKYGSLDMLKNRPQHKITDMAAFATEHPVIWYIGNTQEAAVPPHNASWVAGPTVSVTDPITGNTIYKATQYTIAP